MITDLDELVRGMVRKALERHALGDAFSFMCGPAVIGGANGLVYTVMIQLPSPVVGETLMRMGHITLPINTLELEDMVAELVGQLRSQRSAVLGVGFPPAAAERTVARGI